jgi:GH24 family phage-related lysozyme (muramidase)
MAIDRATFEYVWGNGHTFERIITPWGAKQIARWEKEVLRWYPDGFWKYGPKKGEPKYSCCYGHQEAGDNWPFVYDPAQTFTKQQALDVFQADLESKASFVRKKLQPHIWVTTSMFQALVSIVFNAGEGNIEEGRILTLFNEGAYTAAIAAFQDHIYAWEKVKDESGNDVIGADGKPLKHRVKKNGLINRRGTEQGICMTYIER